MNARLKVEVLQWTGDNHRAINYFIKSVPTASMTGPHPEIGDATESRTVLLIFSDKRYELKQEDMLVKTLDGSHLWVIPKAEIAGLIEPEPT